jgi:hypothetical protein
MHAIPQAKVCHWVSTVLSSVDKLIDVVAMAAACVIPPLSVAWAIYLVWAMHCAFVARG